MTTYAAIQNPTAINREWYIWRLTLPRIATCVTIEKCHNRCCLSYVSMTPVESGGYNNGRNFQNAFNVLNMYVVQSCYNVFQHSLPLSNVG